MTGQIHVDPAELKGAVTRLRSAGSALTPLGPTTPRGIGVYGFPLLATAVERFVASIDERLRTGADLLTRQVDGLGQTAQDFESFDQSAQSDLSALLRKL
jgi:hypothetical protein